MIWLVSDEVRDGENLYYIWTDEIAGSIGINVIFDNKNVMVNGYLNQEDLTKIINEMK